MVKRNLAGCHADLRVEGIQNTSFSDSHFDLVTCNASMSRCEDLVACFNEIYRILKPGRAAYSFEPQKDLDIDQIRFARHFLWQSLRETFISVRAVRPSF